MLTVASDKARVSATAFGLSSILGHLRHFLEHYSTHSRFDDAVKDTTGGPMHRSLDVKGIGIEEPRTNRKGETN